MLTAVSAAIYKPFKFGWRAQVMKKAFHLRQRIKLKDCLIQVCLMRLVDLVPLHVAMPILSFSVIAV